MINGAVALPLETAELTFTASGNSLVRRSILPSGVRILSEKRAGCPQLNDRLTGGCGSRDELPDTYGSTHFLEHLLFKAHRRCRLSTSLSHSTRWAGSTTR